LKTQAYTISYGRYSGLGKCMFTSLSYQIIKYYLIVFLSFQNNVHSVIKQNNIFKILSTGTNIILLNVHIIFQSNRKKDKLLQWKFNLVELSSYFENYIFNFLTSSYL